MRRKSTALLSQMSRLRVLFCLVAVALLIFTGCSAPRVTYRDLQFLSTSQDGNSFPYTGSFYCGNHRGHDYFKLDPHGGFYRVEVHDSPVEARFPFTKDRERWINWPLRPPPMPGDRVLSIEQLTNRSAGHWLFPTAVPAGSPPQTSGIPTNGLKYQQRKPEE
jgi:hypothetical protein